MFDSFEVMEEIKKKLLKQNFATREFFFSWCVSLLIFGEESLLRSEGNII